MLSTGFVVSAQVKRERNPSVNPPKAVGAGKGLKSHPSSAEPIGILLYHLQNSPGWDVPLSATLLLLQLSPTLSPLSLPSPLDSNVFILVLSRKAHFLLAVEKKV